jgi:ubiquinol-cytochrome c reductase iron-sulfur subunit
MAGDDVIGDTPVDTSRRVFLTAATATTGAIGALFVAYPFVSSWMPSERARALGAPVPVDLTKVDPGQMILVMWRKQPIFVVKRTPQMIASLGGHDDRLKDPASASSDQPVYAKNVQRSRTPEVLVLIAVCTHLGCLPKTRFEAGFPELGANWPGGFFCPCHGSRFDLAGRVFDGSPASVNLRVPPYSFPNAQTLLIGEDSTSAKGAA